MKKILSGIYFIFVMANSIVVYASEISADALIIENNNTIILYDYHKPVKPIQRETMTYYERDNNNVEVETGKMVIDYDRNGLVEKSDYEGYGFDGSILEATKLRKTDQGWIEKRTDFEYESDPRNNMVYYTDEVGRIINKIDTQFVKDFNEVDTVKEVYQERYQYDYNHQLQGYVSEQTYGVPKKMSYVYSGEERVAMDMEDEGEVTRVFQYKSTYDEQKHLTLYTITQSWDDKTSERYFRYTKFNQIGDWIESERSSSSQDGYLLRIQREVRYYE